jgi:hypothetical protein
MVTQLSILTAVLDGRVEELRTVITSIPLDDASPFASVSGTHNGRWVVVSTDPSPTAPLRAGGLPGPMLMCSAVIDSPVSRWVDRLLAVLGPTADAIWSHCAGWPGATGSAEFLLAHRVMPWLTFATWDAPVDTVIEALAARRRAEQFAVRTQGHDAERLLAAYRAEFSR